MRDLAPLLTRIALLSDPAAVALILLIGKHAVPVGGLHARDGTNRATVEARLQRLRSADLVTPNRRGREIIYTLTKAGRRTRRLLLRLASRAVPHEPASEATQQREMARLARILAWLDTPNRVVLLLAVGEAARTGRELADELGFSVGDVRANLVRLQMMHVAQSQRAGH